ncbi:MAG: tetratricopeptide repeat protein [Candidatus Pedobacter colombiensis]|uniref:Tetratricopeptide repeat protein n=1 Tax=Candidatus Pedobacter colombiensis TaxID=3121371 RepID=A0AAJ6B7U6_9SPHI|nr:tetratricopeptide repeat protein [Pedobacter sp.]WEK20670.1 MAG: tetratricopeptide repeat protein [Pedobacter sp.]
MTLKGMRNFLKYNLCAWLLLFAMPLCTSAKEIDAEALLKRGNAAYAKNQFSEAATVYQEALDAGYQSANVYFNLGNAQYKLAEMPAAILNYEKALKLAPGDADIKLNLQLANLKITDKIEEIPEFFLSKWWKGFVLFFSLSTLSVFTIVCFIAGFILLIAYLFLIAVWPKKMAFYAGIIVLSLGLIFLIMSGVQSHYLNAHQQGIVFSGAVDVKSGPDGQQKTLFVIHEGTKVIILEEVNDWAKVVLANGNGGWIKLLDIKEI